MHVVEAWHAALNEGDMDRLVGLSHPDVEFGGPRGVGQGVQLLREVDRANVRLDPDACSDAGARWSWSRPGSGDRRSRGGDRKPTVASVFAVCDGLVTSLVRYDDLRKR